MVTEQTFFQAMWSAVETSLLDLWERFIGFFPTLLAALIVFIIGWAIAVTAGNVIDRILKRVRVNDAFERIGTLRRAFQRAGIKLDVARFIGALVKWFLIIVFLLAASNILGLHGVSQFLNEIILYIPNIIVAAVIVVVGVLLGNFIQRATQASIETAKIAHGRAVGTIAKWAVYVFVLIAALIQLGIATELLETLVMGFVAMIAIAGGLAFGLGGRDFAQAILNRIKNDIRQKPEK